MSQRVYDRAGCVVFRKTKEAYGGLSNMAAGFPLVVNGKTFLTAEALYQASRFPDRPDIQEIIVSENSPMTAKMRSRAFSNFTRRDWFEVRLRIMRWCLRVKLAQHWTMFGDLLLGTGDLPIVEESRKDAYWGAKADGQRLLVGSNVLGRLLMELRELFKGKGAQELRHVSPPNISDFLLFGNRVGPIGLPDNTQISSGSLEIPRTMDPERTHLFVNYATEDAQFVDWLCLKLVAQGYRVWCDRLKLFGGESYPSDIDIAISKRTFRFVSVLSSHSIHKANPTKERTLALSLAREREEDFVIPLNLDGLKPSELGWMQSDLTFISFAPNWGDGLSQLLRALAFANAPKLLDGASEIQELLSYDSSTSNGPERLWSNLVHVERLPADLYRYEHANAITRVQAFELLRQWPHYRENATVCWAFEPPPADFASHFDFSSRGVCKNWRIAEGPDINFYNLGKKVLNSALRHKFLSLGFQEDVKTGSLYAPEGLLPERFIYRSPNGNSWIRVTGVRKVPGSSSGEKMRYHLAPWCRFYLNYFNSDVVHVKIRLHFTDKYGQSLDPKLIVKRRKAICKTWWNHEWLARIFATLELLSNGQDRIEIGAERNGIIALARWPRMLEADMCLNEDQLRPATLAAQEYVDTSQAYPDGEGIASETGQPNT